MTDDKPGRGSDQFALRFPEGMRDEIKEAARANGRSMNAEIIDRLEASFVANTELALANLVKKTDGVEKLVHRIIESMNFPPEVEASFKSGHPAKSKKSLISPPTKKAPE